MMKLELIDENKIREELFRLRVCVILASISIGICFYALYYLNNKIDALIATQPEAPTYKTEMLLDL